MHGAPAVSYPVPRCTALAIFSVLILLLGAVVWLVWVWQLPAWGQRQLLPLPLWLLACGLVWAAWRRSPKGSLIWDGQHWYWAPVARPQVLPVRGLSVSLDWQQFVLLRLQLPGAPALYLCLCQRSAPNLWRACRCAIFAASDPSTAHESKASH